jgi:hypothetical protein
MSAEKALFDAYHEWHRLARAEGSAIRSGNWNLLQECQSRVRQFPPLITRLTCEARGEWRESTADPMAKEKKLQTIISGLMESTRQNLDLIRARRELARAKQEAAAAASRNLKRLQSSYAAARPGRWVSFS